MVIEDSVILDLIGSKPNKALKLLYDAYYGYICAVVYKMTGDSSLAEDIAQETFVEVWKRRDSLSVNSSLRGYLRKVGVNKTLNHLRSKKSFAEEDQILNVPSRENSSQKNLEAQDLQEVINTCIDKLPEKCRAIFGMSRFEEMSYREISEKLGISIKTVENQMSKALKLMRVAVKNYQLENI